MGLTSERLKTGGGLTSQRLAQKPIEEPGLIKSVVQSAAQPFLKLASTGLGAAEGITGLATEGIGKLVGSERLAEAGRKTALQQTQKKEFGVLGSATPVGYDADGNKLSYLKGLAQAFGVGAEIASNLVTGGGTAIAAKTAFTGTLKAGVKEAAKTGFKAGVTFGLGTGLQKEAEALEKPILESSLNVAIEALGSGVLGTIVSGGIAGTTAIGSAGIRRVAEFVHPAFKEARIINLISNNAEKIRKALNLNKTQRAIETRSSKDVSQFLAEENLVPSVSGGKLVADDIIDALELKAKAENSKFNQLLDDSGSYVSLEQARAKAFSLIRGFGTTIKNELQDLENEFATLEQQFKNAPKDAEGRILIPASTANRIKQFFYSLGKYNKLATPEQQSKAASFRRLGTAFKELVEDSIDDADVRAFNQRLGELQNAIYMFSERNGLPVQGGRLGKYFARTIGAIVGAPTGPEGSIMGALTADKVADLLQDPRITTYAARQYLKLLKQQGKQELIDQVEEILERRASERAGRPLLPASSTIFGQEFKGGKSEIFSQQKAKELLEKTKIKEPPKQLMAPKGTPQRPHITPPPNR